MPSPCSQNAQNRRSSLARMNYNSHRASCARQRPKVTEDIVAPWTFTLGISADSSGDCTGNSLYLRDMIRLSLEERSHVRLSILFEDLTGPRVQRSCQLWRWTMVRATATKLGCQSETDLVLFHHHLVDPSTTESRTTQRNAGNHVNLIKGVLSLAYLITQVRHPSRQMEMWSLHTHRWEAQPSYWFNSPTSLVSDEGMTRLCIKHSFTLIEFVLASVLARRRLPGST